MYDKKLEELIDAALKDGVLTEKEKQVLFKKAQTMGIDLDEFEIVLDARLVEAKKAEAQSAAPKSNKLGDVKKCPACGAMVQSFQGTCSECGYAFEDVQANLSSQKLAEAINKILEEGEKRKDELRKKRKPSKHADVIKEVLVSDKIDEDIWHIDEEINERIGTTIKNFPVPNSKNDLLELITTLGHKSSHDNDDDFRDAYEIKLKECISKAKILFPNDNLLQSSINHIEEVIEKTNKEVKKKAKKELRKATIGVIIMVIIGTIASVLWNWKYLSEKFDWLLPYIKSWLQ